MRVWNRLLFVLVVVPMGACSRPAAGPVLQFVDIGIDEDSHPAAVAVIVENVGDTSAQLKSAKANVGWNYLIAGKVPADELPAGLEHELKPWATPQIAPGSQATYSFDFVWKSSTDAPPMLALIHATLTLEFEGGHSVKSIPATFVIRTRPEIALNQSEAKPDRALRETFEALPGWKSSYSRQLANPSN